MTARLTACLINGMALAVMLSASVSHADMKDARKAHGRGDFPAAFAEFKRLAEAGNVDAQAQLAEIYYTGRGAIEPTGTPKTHALALKWFMAAARQGDVGSQVNLGLILAQNTEYKDAANWFALAAKQGDTAAMNNLAAFYMRGLGVEQDIPKAFAMMEKVADQGDPTDQLQLGMIYLQGVAAPPDMAKGLKWLNRSAEQGHADAQMRLATVLSENAGAEDRLILAYKWFHLAAMQGADNANGFMADLAKKMTADQIADAKRRADAWQP